MVPSALPWTPRRSSATLSQPSGGHVDDEIENARVEYLGRKSALKQALREVRDRETGMALNALRERLESAIDAREAELSTRRARPAADRGARRRHDARHAGSAAGIST